MAGVLDVLPMMRLDFSQVAAGQTERRQLTPRPFDVSAYTEGALLVRVHSLTISASHTIVCRALSWIEQDRRADSNSAGGFELGEADANRSPRSDAGDNSQEDLLIAS